MPVLGWPTPSLSGAWSAVGNGSGSLSRRASAACKEGWNTFVLAAWGHSWATRSCLAGQKGRACPNNPNIPAPGPAFFNRALVEIFLGIKETITRGWKIFKQIQLSIIGQAAKVVTGAA